MQNEILKAKVDIDDKIKLKNSNPDSLFKLNLMYYLSATVAYIVLSILLFHPLYFKFGVGLLKSIILSIILPLVYCLIIFTILRLVGKAKANFPHLTSCLPFAIGFAYFMYHVKKYY
jgi:hypothetical protein